MKTRQRASRGERQSWRDRDAPISSGLLFYRRITATLLVLLFVGAFIAVLVWFWPRRVQWTSEHLVIAEYDPDSAPPLNYADKQKQAWTSGLESNDVAGSATQTDVLAASVAKLAGSVQQRRSGPLLVYVAGHGCSRGDEALLYASDLDPFGDKAVGVNVKDLLAAVAKHPAQQTVLIVDSGPLEHDLRVGTAVNRFPEILESEVEKLPLAEGEELIVLASHQMWERAFVSPVEHWSVFGFYVNEALASPDANADKRRFDRGASDGQISLLEFAGYVQQQVSSWVWQASNRTRTQRPLLIYAKGSLRRSLDLVHDAKGSRTDSELDGVLKSLDQIILPTVKMPPADDGATAAFFSLESTAYGQEPVKTPPTAEKVGAAESPPGEKTATKAPAAAAEAAPPAKDTRPPWLQAHSRLIHDSFGKSASAAGEEWTASDYDATAVRRALRDMLYAQQKELAGVAGDAVKLDDVRPVWDPLRDWQTDPPTLSKLRQAARARNAGLLRLEQYIQAVDAAEGLAHDDMKLIDELDALWRDVYNAVSRLSESMDQEFFLDTPATDPEGPTINISSGSVSGSVQDIITAGHLAQDGMQKLARRLEELLLARSPVVAGSLASSRWLPRWELAQAVPLAAWDAQWPAFAGDLGIPSLGFPPPPPAVEAKAAPADKQPPPAAASAPKVVLPTSLDVDRVNSLLRKRRKRWLDRQALLANLLPQSSTAATIAVPGDTDGELNAAALQIAQRHQSAVATLKDGSAADVRSQWNADRVLRLALGADADQLSRRQAPMPLNLVKRKEQPYLLRLEGPAEAMDLELGKSQPVRFTIHRGSDRPLDAALAEVRLQVPEGLRVTHADKPIQSGDFPLKALVDAAGQTIALEVSPTRELLISSGGKLEDPLKSLTLVLTLNAVTNAKATSVARFRLPGALYLDVLVAGFQGTIEHRPDQVLAGGTAADREFHLNPPPAPEDAASAADRGQVKLHLRPMPQGETSYRLHVVNRSVVPRNVLAKWHVLDDPRPASSWTEVQGQIGEASLKQRLKPELIPPGRKWLLPVYEEDQKLPPPPAGSTPPAAAAPPPAEPKPPLFIGTGLVCQLTDLNDPDWTQWIWITAQPRHPDTYVSPGSRLTGNAGVVETVLQDHPASSALLPPGRITLIRGNPRSGLEGRRVAFSQKEVRGVLAKGDLTIVAQLPARGPDDVEPIPFSLDVDGYPRALRFLAGTSTVQPVSDRGAVQLRLLAIADPPMPGKEDALLTSGQLYFAKAPKLRCEIEADFPIDHANYAVRLVRADEFSQQLEEFYADRVFDVACQRQPPEASAKTNLALTCQIGELGGPLDWLTAETGFVPPLRLKLRAEIVEFDARGRFEPLKNPVQHELEIVLDDQPPTLVKGPAATLDWDKRKPLPLISFTLSDDDAAGRGSGLAEVQWGTLKKGEDALMDPQSLPLPASASREVQLHIAVPPKALAMEGKPLDILIVARDRAGNRLGPELLQTINVKAIPAKAQAPKGSDTKK
ncbi:MAG TPA: hypothetical protein VMP01_21165 [Pirellulaceae bacterium]|nr:hypothetical protein [Pirellulaceae bacterium]